MTSYLGHLGIACVVMVLILIGLFDRILRRFPGSLTGLWVLGLIGSIVPAIVLAGDSGGAYFVGAYIALAMTDTWWAFSRVFRQQRGRMPKPGPKRLPLLGIAFGVYLIVGVALEIAYGDYGSAGLFAIPGVVSLGILYWRFRIGQWGPRSSGPKANKLDERSDPRYWSPE